MRALKWIGGTVLVLLLLPVVLAGLVLGALNTAPGQREGERLLASVLGPDIVVAGLSGRFPDAPRVRHVELRDAGGVWLAIDDIALDWSPTRLLSKVAHVDRLAVGHVAMPRLPEPSAAKAQPSSSSSSSFSLPVRVEVDAAHVERVDLGAPVAGAAASLAVDATAQLDSLKRGAVTAAIHRLDGAGTYTLSGRIDERALRAKIDLDEPLHGFVGTLAKLPDLGALSAHATVDGPWTGAATRLAITAGPLQAAADGTVNIDGQAADLDVTAHAPAMTPRPDLHWQAVALDAHVHGPFTRPDATATLQIDALAAAGAGLQQLRADVKGNAGQVALNATVTGLTVPGPKPDVLAAAPLVLTANARLDAPDRPVTFTLSHPLIAAQGTARTGGDIAADVALALPDLAPLASAGGIDLHGSSKLAIKAATGGGTTHADIDGTLGITGGLAPVPGLVGPNARIGVSAAVTGSDVSVSRLQVDGQTVTVSATGGFTGGTNVALDWKVALADLAVLAPQVSGKLDAHGHVGGTTTDLSATADAAGELATKGFPRAPVKLAVKADGLPGKPAGTVEAEATLEGAPLTLAANATRAADGALAVTIERAHWKSTDAAGALALAAGAKIPTGKVTLRVGSLADFDAFVGQTLAGSLDASLDADRETARLQLEARNAGLPGSGVASAKLNATVAHPLDHPRVQASLAIDGLRAGTTQGSVRLNLDGPEEALGLKLETDLANLAGAPLQAASTGTLDVPTMNLAIATFTANWKGETLRLLAPTRVSLAGGLSVERTRIGLRDAVLEVAGKISPRLDLTASLRNVSADLVRIVMPDLQAQGTLTADARITGTAVRPDGTVRIAANGLRLRTGPAAGLPPADITATIGLAGTSARVDARVTAGRNQVTLAGTAPLAPDGPVALRAAGTVDLAVTDPILTAQGRRARGVVTLDAGVTGTLAAPRANGTVRLAGGEVEDYGQGVRISDIQALIEANGDTVRITRFTGKAGAGTLSAAGTVGLAAPMPVNLAVTARNASPLSGDRLKASLNADLTLRGAVAGRLDAGGTIRVNSAEIRVPETMPTQVATLDVHRPGAAPPATRASAAQAPAGAPAGAPVAAPVAPSSTVGLNLTIDAPGQIFVRGRGLDAELQGNLRVRGTTAAPLISGGFKMRRGTFTLVGQSLTFTTGEVTFDGSGRIDPVLNFVATTSTAVVTANLAVTGYASKPVITLGSTPQLPQDEVLAQLLFGQSASSLSPFQLAEIAAALAQIAGVGGGGPGVLDSIRGKLGLDRLSVGGGNTTSSATVEAGRYVAPGVYVGAKQGTSGGSQATVQIDLTKGLKLETTVGTGGSATGAATSGQSQGTGVGLTYQFEY